LTVVDQLDVVSRGLGPAAGWPTDLGARAPRVSVCWEIDVARFKRMLFAGLGEAARA
jgi:hypothetical protein